MSAETKGETEAWEAARLTQSLTQSWGCACLQGWVCRGPETGPLLSLVWAWRGGIKAQDLFDPSLGKGQVCSCPGRAARRRHFAERNTEVVVGLGGGRALRSRDLLRKSSGGLGEEFLPFQTFLPWRAQPPKGPKATATRTADISCGAAPPTVRCQPETGHRGRRGGRPHRPENAKPFQKAEAGDRPPPTPHLRKKEPSHTRGPPGRAAWSPRAHPLGETEAGLWEGPRCPSPRGAREGPEVRLALWF